MSLTLSIRFSLEHMVSIFFEPLLQQEAVSHSDGEGLGLFWFSFNDKMFRRLNLGYLIRIPGMLEIMLAR